MEDIDNERINEKIVFNSDLKKINDLADVIKSVCKIICPGSAGTGFLIKLFIKDKPFKCLITCEHVINQKLIDSKRKIDIFYDNQNKHIQIILNEERFIRNYRYLNIDATVIEIIDKDNIKDYYFLKPNLNYLNGYEEFEGKEIYIVQYPEAGDLSKSEGKINKIIHPYAHEFSHLSSTLKGSSGSPIILKGSKFVLGIHKQGDKKKGENYGNFIGPIITSLKNDFPFKKEKIIIEQFQFLIEYEDQGNKLLGKFLKIEKNRKECYIGETKKFFPIKEGKGTLYTLSNEKKYNIIYEGEFESDKFNGKGKFYFIDGNLGYEGEFKEGEIINGKHYSGNGELLYEGEFKNFEYEGYGQQWFVEQIYIGNFHEGKFDGEGIVYDKNNKIVCNGNFKCGKLNGFGRYYKDDGEYYIGNFDNGVRSGKGKVFDKNDNLIYEGDFNNNYYEGNGTYYFDDETFYTGQFFEGQRNGKGKLLDKDENIIYEGEYKNEKKDGEGIWRGENGDFYVGEIVGNMRHGKGILYDKNNEIIYDGEYKNDEKDGQGFLKYNDSGFYIGHFKNGKRHGQGIKYDYEGNIIYDGEFKLDKYDGKGKLIFKDGGMYEGEFSNGEYHGKGILNDKNNKLIYEGEFKYGKRDGNGTAYFDGGKYIGQHKGGEWHGKGELYINNKKVYKGDFKSNKYDGKGIYYFDDGYTYEGEFKNDKKEGEGIIYNKNGKKIYNGKFVNDKPEDDIILNFLKNLLKIN